MEKTITALTAAASGLKTITGEMLGYDRDKIELCVRTAFMLENEVAELSGEIEPVTDADLEGVDLELVGDVAVRTASIECDLELLFKRANADDDPDAEIIERIQALRVEKSRLTAFLQCGFDELLLVGTEFERA